MSKSHYLTAAVTLVLAAAVFGSHSLSPPAWAPASPSEDVLEAKLATVKRATVARCELVNELIAGTRGLADVAARFRDLSADQLADKVVHLVYPGATQGERYCRQVIGFADAALDGRPDRAAVLARLTVELDQMVAAGGRLPDFAGAD